MNFHGQTTDPNWSHDRGGRLNSMACCIGRSSIVMMNAGNILIWNVHGLNSRAQCDVVRDLVASEHPSIVCLQETKLSVISMFHIMHIAGSDFEYFYLPTPRRRYS
jgi:hypothetical protein